MAKKTLGFTIEVAGSKETIDKLARVNTEIAQVAEQIKQVKSQSTKAIKNGATADAEEYQRQIIALTQKQQQLKEQAKGLGKEINNTGAAFRAAASATGSYDQLNNQLKVLTAQFKALSQQDLAAGKGDELTAEINRLQNELKTTDAKLGIFTRNVGDYEGAILRALKNAGQEDALQKQLQQIEVETNGLKAKAAQL